jgi:hypothetical protein
VLLQKFAFYLYYLHTSFYVKYTDMEYFNIIQELNMFSIHKLRADHSIIGLIPALVSLFITALIGIFFGREAALTFLAIVFWGFSAYTFTGLWRTRNPHFIAPALYLLFGGLMIFFKSPASRGNPPPLVSLFILLTVAFLFWTIYLSLTKKVKWRGREILEMAAAPVEETGDGFTNRPLPGGKTNFSKQQILEFAEFASRNLIAIPFMGDNKVVFIPVMMGREFGYMLGLKRDYLDDTWVSFDFDGNVSVNISHSDYMKYQEALSFDQLCASMGDLFIEFIDTHQRGEGMRIISRMDNMRVGIFS